MTNVKLNTALGKDRFPSADSGIDNDRAGSRPGDPTQCRDGESFEKCGAERVLGVAGEEEAEDGETLAGREEGEGAGGLGMEEVG